VKADEYIKAVGMIPFGKVLSDATYHHSSASVALPELLCTLEKKWRDQLGLGDSFNLLKWGRRSPPSMSFLRYDDFFEIGHPALIESVKVDLISGQAKRTDYRKSNNPPILHRKELFLLPDHPSFPDFHALTQKEESFGLYEKPMTIGFRQNWERLLAEAGVEVAGNQVVPVETSSGETHKRRIDRHKTAIVRYELSKPLKLAMERSVLSKGLSFFDYGCGHGTDIKGLNALGYEAGGWDPVHANESSIDSADIVNLGYVINVIEDSAERVETLKKAWTLAGKAIIVSAMVRGQDAYANAQRYKDGFLTQRNTFQKYFEQTELQTFIEDVLGTEAYPLSLGMFVAFRLEADAQDFLSRSTRRAINWNQIAERIGFERPKPKERVPRPTVYDRNQELLDDFFGTLLSLGRIPLDTEFGRLAEVRKACGSAPKAVRLFVSRFGEEELEKARQSRSEDLLVYLTGGEFQKRRTPVSRLSRELRADIKTHFANYQDACEKARHLLFASGDTDELEIAIGELEFGWFDAEEMQFTVEASLVERLPPILRIFASCATRLYGDLSEAHLVKFHLRSAKLSLMTFERWEHLVPRLAQRIKIDLRSLFVNVFEYPSDNPPVLFFKERFCHPDHEKMENMKAFSKRLRKLGINESNVGHGIQLVDYQQLVALKGLTEGLNPRK